MDFVKKIRFSGGELDPALGELISLNKYQTSYRVGRNYITGKSGRPYTRPGRSHYIATKIADREALVFEITYTKYVVEFGHLYARIHDIENLNYIEVVHTYTESELPDLQFLYINNTGEASLSTVTFSDSLLIFKSEATINYIDGLTSATPTFGPVLFRTPELLVVSGDVSIAGVPAGYAVEYQFTMITHLGEEGKGELCTSSAGVLKLPIAADQANVIVMTTGETPDAFEKPQGFNVFRRPASGGAYGYVGSATEIVAGPNGSWNSTFVDVGDDADYSVLAPTLNASIEPEDFKPKTATVCQKKLVIGNTGEGDDVVLSSRTKFLVNFLRDYPLSGTSSLSLECGSSEQVAILRLLDDGALLAFTTVGLFANDDAPFGPANTALRKKGQWVIQENLPPLFYPDGILFIDSGTNSVRDLFFSNDRQKYVANEISVYANHLFKGRKVKNWSFHSGDTPIIWLVFEDGKAATLTYIKEQEMIAFNRHDSFSEIRGSASVRLSDAKYKSVFLVERDGQQYIEIGADRNPADFKDFVGMDSAKTFKSTVRDVAAQPNAVFTLTKHEAEWDEHLILSSDVAVFLNTAGRGQLGTIFKIFNTDGESFEFRVLEFQSTLSVKVQPSAEIPEEIRSGFELYQTFQVLTGLDHLEGQYVSIIVDGGVVASPNNDYENYDQFQVIGGQIDLTEENRGAFVHVGLPFTADLQLLRLDSLDGKPNFDEVLVSEVRVSFNESRGLYVGEKFPANDKVKGMHPDRGTWVDDPDEETIGNAALSLKTGEFEVSIDSRWNMKGGDLVLRQVDPLPAEITSISPKLTGGQ